MSHSLRRVTDVPAFPVSVLGAKVKLSILTSASLALATPEWRRVAAANATATKAALWEDGDHMTVLPAFSPAAACRSRRGAAAPARTCCLRGRGGDAGLRPGVA